MRKEVRVVDQRRENYRWTEDLNAAFQLQYQTKPEGNGAGVVAAIRKLTGWPWHVCRTQACLLGFSRPHVHHEWTAPLDEILESGYEAGGKAKEESIKRIHAQTGWPRHVCWNRARKLGLAQVRPRKWTEDDDKYLLDFVNSKNLREIVKRLKRTVAAVRKRLLKLGGERKLSARVTDGHTKSELAQYLSCSRKTIQRWIDEGLLKGRYEGRNRQAGTRGKGRGSVEQIPVREYRLTSSRLRRNERADGVVAFERPTFKQSHESYFLQIAESAAVDRPSLAPIDPGRSQILSDEEEQ